MKFSPILQFFKLKHAVFIGFVNTPCIKNHKCAKFERDQRHARIVHGPFPFEQYNISLAMVEQPILLVTRELENHPHHQRNVFVISSSAHFSIL